MQIPHITDETWANEKESYTTMMKTNIMKEEPLVLDFDVTQKPYFIERDAHMIQMRIPIEIKINGEMWASVENPVWFMISTSDLLGNHLFNYECSICIEQFQHDEKLLKSGELPVGFKRDGNVAIFNTELVASLPKSTT